MEIDTAKYPLPGRVRHHTAPNLYMPLSELKRRPGYYPPTAESLDWDDWFSDGRPPQALDIGCGKGAFLLEYAMNNPEINILGIELRKALTEWIGEIIKGEKIANCAALWYSVANGLGFIGDGTLSSIFYLFPDPWPKRKHLKRRAFNENLLNEIHRTLVPGGRLYLATDVPEVHEYHLSVLGGGLPDYEIIRKRGEWELPVTNKERFCLKKNIDVYRIICTIRAQ